jgi:hypothetical protein
MGRVLDLMVPILTAYIRDSEVVPTYIMFSSALCVNEPTACGKGMVGVTTATSSTAALLVWMRDVEAFIF